MSDWHGWDGLASVTKSHLHGLDGWLDDIANGVWDEQFDDSSRKEDLIEMLRALGEHARFTRMAFSTALHHGNTEAALKRPIEHIAAVIDVNARHGLPFNRKERYFTGTVLPFIVASDGFAHFDRFLRMCGVERVYSDGLEGNQGFQFFTEYAFGESTISPRDDSRFPIPRPGGDTPDIVIRGEDWLLAIEAKMFHRPMRASLQGQLTKQRTLIDYIARRLDPPVQRVAHVALLPEPLRRDIESNGSPLPGVTTITWEQIAAEYRVVAPRYWLAQLDYAIAHYDELASNGTYGKYSDAKLTGGQIYEGYRDHDPEVTQYTYMGRSRGMSGPLMQKKDLVDGAWIWQPYEVRRHQRVHANWFPIADFLAALPDTPPI